MISTVLTCGCNSITHSIGGKLRRKAVRNPISQIASWDMHLDNEKVDSDCLTAGLIVAHHTSATSTASRGPIAKTILCVLLLWGVTSQSHAVNTDALRSPPLVSCDFLDL